VAERAAEVSRIAETLKPITNPNMASDLTTGIALAQAALTGALSNVEINVGSMKAGFPGDDEFMKETRARVAKVRA
jgi:formiminotetrahydrofolate cyclodeaminase